MPTSTTNYGLIKPGTDDPILIGQINDNMDTVDTVLKDHSDKIDAAALGIKYKGEVNYYADLPNNAEIGDAYTVKYAGSSGTTLDGTEYVWGAVSGVNQWINFSKDSYSKAEVDALLALKQNALSSAQLAAVNSGINSAKVEQIETNENNISWNAKSGVSNVLPLNTVYKRGVHADVTEPSKIHFYGTPDSGGTLSGLTKRMALKEGTYTITVITDFDTSLNADIYVYDMTSSDTIITVDTSGTYEFTANPAHEYYYAFYFNQGVTVDFNYQVTVRPKNSPDIGFQPYAMSNAELTAAIQALQAQLANQ